MAHTACIGCIANPMAGKDIRRLVAYGSRIDNQEKVSIVRRMLLGLESVRGTRVLFMPDTFHTGVKALEGIRHSLDLEVEFLDMDVQGTARDTLRATQRMREAGAHCLVVLGGDGTHRVVAKASGAIPLVPISSGTNNVFPRTIEGTLAGMAAGLYARYGTDLHGVVLSSKRLEVLRQGELEDIALVDAAVSMQQFVGARALWDVTTIQELFLTQGTPTAIGLSSIGGWSDPVDAQDEEGLHLILRNDEVSVRAPIGPGLIVPVGIAGQRRMRPGDRVHLRHAPSLLALDGERELLVRAEERWEIMLTWNGPKILDVERTLREAQRLGLPARNPGA